MSASSAGSSKPSDHEKQERSGSFRAWHRSVSTRPVCPLSALYPIAPVVLRCLDGGNGITYSILVAQLISTKLQVVLTPTRHCSFSDANGSLHSSLINSQELAVLDIC
jgi:hypothetical protein